MNQLEDNGEVAVKASDINARGAVVGDHNDGPTDAGWSRRGRAVSRRVRIMFEIVRGEENSKGVMWDTKRFTSKIEISSGNTGGGKRISVFNT